MHDGFVDEAPPIEHHLATEPDFWIDPQAPGTISEQLAQIEQTLSSAPTTRLASIKC